MQRARPSLRVRAEFAYREPAPEEQREAVPPRPADVDPSNVYSDISDDDTRPPPAQRSLRVRAEFVGYRHMFVNQAVPTVAMSDEPRPAVNFSNTNGVTGDDNIRHPTIERTPPTQQTLRVEAELVRYGQTSEEQEAVPIATMSGVLSPEVNFENTYSDISDDDIRHPSMECTPPVQQTSRVLAEFVQCEQTFEEHEAVPTVTMSNVPCPAVNFVETFGVIRDDDIRHQRMECSPPAQQLLRVAAEPVRREQTFEDQEAVPAVTMSDMPSPEVNFENTCIDDEMRHRTLDFFLSVQQSSTAMSIIHRPVQMSVNRAVPTATMSDVPNVNFSNTYIVISDDDSCDSIVECTPPVQQSSTASAEFIKCESPVAEHEADPTTSHPTMECTPPVQQSSTVKDVFIKCEHCGERIAKHEVVPTPRNSNNADDIRHPTMECIPPVQQSSTVKAVFIKCEHCGERISKHEVIPTARNSNNADDIGCPKTKSTWKSSMVKCQQAFEEHNSMLTATTSNVNCPEIDYLKTNGVISDDLIRKLIVQRETFAEQLQNGNMTSKKCLEQIKLESKLLEICNAAIKERTMEVDSKENILVNILAVLSNRINLLYYCTFQLSPVDLPHLTSYAKFCSNYKQHITIKSDVLNEVLSKQHSDPEVYISAARFLYDNSLCDLDTARRHIAVGLKYHRKYSNLYVADFWFETQLLHDNGGKSLLIALRKYKKYIQIFRRNFSFHIALLDCTLRFNKGGELPFYVINDMIDRHKLNELMWQKLAYTYLDGIVFDRDGKRLNYDQHCKRRLENCIKAYEDGLLLLRDKSLIKLWNLYMDHVIDLWKQYGMRNESLRAFLNEEMEKVFLRAREIGVLNKPHHFFYWAEHWDKQRSYISKMAIKLHNNNPTIWVDLLNLYAINENHNMVKKVFKDACRSLGHDELSWPLWQSMSSYYNKRTPDSVIKFYELAINHPHTEISLRLKHKYLMWTINSKGVIATRKLFNEWKNTNLTSLKVYTFMIRLERSLTLPNLEIISRLYFEACMKYGEENLDLWKVGLRFAYMCGEHRWANQIFNISNYLLEKKLVDELQTEFEVIKNEIANRHRITNPNVVVIDDDDSSPDHPARNEHLQTTAVNCTPSTSTVNHFPLTSISTDNVPSTSTYNHLSTTIYYNCPPVSTEINEFNEIILNEYSTRHGITIDPNVIVIMDDDDSPPDHSEKNECPSTSLNKCPSTSTVHCPSTSTVNCPSTSTVNYPSTSTVNCPSTATYNYPSTSTYNYPLTSAYNYLLTSAYNYPSTYTYNYPSTSTYNYPSTYTYNYPSTYTYNYPSTSTVNCPPTSTVNCPSTSTVNHPSTSTVNCLSTTTYNYPSTYTYSCPSTSIYNYPSTSTVNCPSTSTVNCPSTSTVNHPSTSTVNCLSTATYNYPSTYTYNYPSTSIYNYPSTSTVNCPSTSTVNHPSTSTVNCLSTATYNYPSTYTYSCPSTSIYNYPSTSTVNYPSTSTVNCPSTSTVNCPSTSTVNPSTSTVNYPSTSTYNYPSTSTDKSLPTPSENSPFFTGNYPQPSAGNCPAGCNSCSTTSS